MNRCSTALTMPVMMWPCHFKRGNHGRRCLDPFLFIWTRLLKAKVSVLSGMMPNTRYMLQFNSLSAKLTVTVYYFLWLLTLKIDDARSKKLALWIPIIWRLPKVSWPRFCFWAATSAWQVSPQGPSICKACNTIEFSLLVSFLLVNFCPFFRYRRRTLMPASSAFIGLAAPGQAGSWQTETKVS